MLANVGYLGYVTLDEEACLEEGITRICRYALKTVHLNETSVSYSVDHLVRGLGIAYMLQTVYTHDLAYLASYLESYLLSEGYAQVEGGRYNRQPNTYSVLRTSDMKVFSFTITNAHGYPCELIDVLNIYPSCTMSELAHNLDIPYDDTNIDVYNKKELAKHVVAQVQVIESLMLEQFKVDDTVRLTRSAYAYNELIQSYEENSGLDFNLSYPSTTREAYNMMLPGYWGAKTYINTPGEVYEDVVQLDYSSSFPSIMADAYLPIGEPEAYKGKFKVNKHELFIQRFIAKFKLREGKIPTLNKAFGEGNTDIYSDADLTTKVLESYKGSPVLVLSSIDFKLFLEHYKVTEIEYIDGYKFKTVKGPFKEFVHKHYKGKEEAKKEGNFIKGLMHKLTMNMSYGKFAQKRNSKLTRTELDVYGWLKFVKQEATDSDKNYLPMAIFIAAYGRQKLFTAVRGIETHWLYGDTDSIHISAHVYEKHTTIKDGNTYFNGILVKPNTLGALTYEKKYTKARYLKEKTYVGVEADGKLTFKASGLTDKAKSAVTRFEDVDYGLVLATSDRQLVNGGYIKVTINKTI